ncbi:MAG: ATP synthase F1 subunit epsilon [Verrucomicrobiota bacterium]
MHLEIVTPEKKIFSDQVENVYLPGADGELGILPEHTGLVTALQPGELRYQQNGQVTTLAIGSGFAEVDQKKCVVLTDSALGEAEIDEAATEAAMKRAQEKLAGIDHNVDAEEIAHLQNIIAQGAAALRFKRRHHS